MESEEDRIAKESTMNDSPEFPYKPPYNVRCPKCFAVRGGRCLEPVKDGSRFVDVPHVERVERSKESA